jgi:hypothetical protein
MPDKFSTEIELVNKFRINLVDSRWNIIQLVCSGGQAHFSISYRHNGKLKNIFPDVVAYNDEHILIGEIKEMFDENDYNKLLELKASDEGLKKLSKVISMRSGNTYEKQDIIFSLIHSENPYPQIESIHQYVYTDGDFLINPPIQ